jgi:hypothetical protein
MATAKQASPRAGMAVDASGRAAYDPSENVKALNEAANKRQDDLREAHAKLMETEIRCLKEMAALRDAHARELRMAEASRLDAIRQVDQLNVSTAAASSAQQISTLAATTQATAETLRNAVIASAQTIATQTATAMGALIERVAALEKTSYVGTGKGAGLGTFGALMLQIIPILLTVVALVYLGRRG